MNFGDAIGECFFNYANFRDRATRAEYWWWALFATVVLLIGAGLDYLVFRDWETGPFYLVLSLASFLPSLSVTVRRLHDTNRTGWWIMLPFGAMILFFIGFIAALTLNPLNPFGGVGLALIAIPLALVLAVSILLLIWMILPGDAGNNRYGPNRYAGS